jgi:hypothetical protein
MYFISDYEIGNLFANTIASFYVVVSAWHLNHGE